MACKISGTTALILPTAVILIWPTIQINAAASIPDFSTRWARNSFSFESPLSGPGPVTNLKRLPDGTSDAALLVGDFSNPILNPEAAAKLKSLGEMSLSGIAFPTPNNQCRPGATPYIWAVQFEVQLLQTEDQITILYSQGNIVRRVRMNATHPARVTPTWQGDSVGRYEGDTLVVDTVGIKVGPLSMVDWYGTPHSKNLHVVERYRLIDGDAAKEAAEAGYRENGRIYPGNGIIDPDYDGKGLQVQFTVNDPDAFITPWSGTVTFRRADRTFPEWICAENPREYYAGKDTEIPRAETPDF
jgi:hypothetical protein